MTYSILISNMGQVATFGSKRDALKEYAEWREAKPENTVALLQDGEPVRESFPVTVEMTDTFAGEANYAWVRRFKFNAENARDAVRQAKKLCGYSGIRCNVEHNDMTTIRPRGDCVVIFITWENN